MPERRAILIGRHQMIPAQVKELEECGIKIVKQIPTVNDVEEVVKLAKQEKARFIIVTALPFHLLLDLYEALPSGIKILVPKVYCAGIVNTKEEAEKFVAENPDYKYYIPSREGTYRLMVFGGWHVITSMRVKMERLHDFLIKSIF